MADRTVVNELQNGSTQSSLACKACRRKKLKCDRNIPQCRNCQKASRACDYPAVAHKPGPRPGTHRRHGETRRTAASKSQSMTSNDSPYGGSSHDATDTTYSPESRFPSANDSPFSAACKMMQMSEQFCLRITQVFFENMSFFLLFHQPTFLEKLSAIDSAKEVQALLTSMLAIAIRYMSSADLPPEHRLQPDEILRKAHVLNAECLDLYQDGPPPLHLLQSLVLQTFLATSHGIRGRVWRLVGQCIRIAYELRLHELDIDTTEKLQPSDASSESNSDSWVAREEKRRVWWAIWECDVFASTLQRAPKCIDWSRSRTNLPSPDEAWFNGSPRRSCWFRMDPNRRWRDLRDSGNTNAIAWFIVLNSYKWESLSITRRMLPPTDFFDNEDQIKNRFEPGDYRPVLERKRETLENCLRNALTAIPSVLQPNSYLSFKRSRGPYPILSLAHDHGLYMVHVMSQVVSLLLSQRDLEGSKFISYPMDFNNPAGTATAMNTHSRDEQQQQQQQQQGGPPTERKRWQRCLLAADAMAQIVRNACPKHYRFVNPNIATALWIAAATQLAVLAYHRDEIDVELARSNIDLLTTTIERFIEFWQVPRTLTQSLITLEQRLHDATSVRSVGFNGAAPAAFAAPTTTPPVAPQAYAGMTTADTGNNIIKHQSRSTPFDTFPTNSNDPTASSAGAVERGGAANQDDPNNIFDSLSPFDVLQAMDFGAMYNGVENWENLFLDPAGFPSTDFVY